MFITLLFRSNEQKTFLLIYLYNKFILSFLILFFYFSARCHKIPDRMKWGWSHKHPNLRKTTHRRLHCVIWEGIYYILAFIEDNILYGPRYLQQKDYSILTGREGKNNLMRRLAQRSGMRRQLRWPNSNSIDYDFMIIPTFQPQITNDHFLTDLQRQKLSIKTISCRCLINHNGERSFDIGRNPNTHSYLAWRHQRTMTFSVYFRNIVTASRACNF